MLTLACLAAAAATVSWDAQDVLVASVKHDPLIAVIEAAIPDVGALIFATLGIALAVHGRHALRARVLNLACVGVSLGMNALASAPGWRAMTIWIMPSAVYALASDTLIGVVRARASARMRRDRQELGDVEGTPMVIVGGVLLWALRLVLAPASTLGGFRSWALEECPVAPGRKVSRVPRPNPQLPPLGQSGTPRRELPGKQDRLIALATERHDLAVLPLKLVSRVANQIAAEIGLSPGTARRVLLGHVRRLQERAHPEAAS